MSAHIGAEMAGWLAQAMATDAPVLPTTTAMQVWLHGGWSVVLAWLGVVLAGRVFAGRERTVQAQWVGALALAAWAWLPGQVGAAYWLGLAFQAPSVAGVLLCALLLVGRRAGGQGTQVGPAVWLACLGALLGWALLLDSLAVLPIQLYAWGFSPMALFLVVAMSLLPWVAWGHGAKSGVLAVCCVVPVAALVFVVWRLPSGNLWDAVLDPWAWFAIQVWLARRGWKRYKNGSW